MTFVAGRSATKPRGKDTIRHFLRAQWLRPKDLMDEGHGDGTLADG
jgi:hypothetical protein